VLAPDTSDADKVLSFNLIDVNHDGKLSREEFLEATFEYLHGVQETELSKVFYGPLLS
jgi:Ca2+-binding EF-hand superfamily protein